MIARLIANDRIAAGTAGFEFELQEPFTFEAGQTCDLTIPAAPYQDGKGPSRTFSIASSPVDLPRVLFATRLTGSAFKRTLAEAAAGFEIGIEGPFGSFVMHKNTARPAVFFAGGIGITPFRSIIKDATERRLPHRMTLFYSNRTAEGSAFVPDFEAWETANANFRLVASVDELPGTARWSHHTGLVNAAFIKPYLDSLTDAVCYLAGPPGFVKAIRSALDELGVDPDSIRTEEFNGY